MLWSVDFLSPVHAGEFGDYSRRRIRRQSPKTATVAVFGDSRQIRRLASVDRALDVSLCTHKLCILRLCSNANVRKILKCDNSFVMYRILSDTTGVSVCTSKSAL